MSNYDLFKYYERYQLVFNNLSQLENFSMYSRQVTIIKGVDNKLYFNIKNHDRKNQFLPGKTILIYCVNYEQDKTFIVKPLEIEDELKGNYALNLSKDEIFQLPNGHYRMFAVVKDNYDQSETLLYSGQDFNPILEMTLTDDVFEHFTPSIDLEPEKWRWDSLIKSYASSIIGSNRIHDRTSDLYTVSVQVEDFIGTVKIQTTFENSETEHDNEWMTVAEYFFGRDATEEELEKDPTKPIYEVTMNKELSFESQGEFFKVLHTPYIYRDYKVKGKINKVLLRY